MRLNWIFTLLPLLAITGCAKFSNDAASAIPLPTGNFAGQFWQIRPDQINKGSYDTIKTNLQLTLSQVSGFKVSGGTTIYAGSYGAYGVNGYYIQFVDETYSPTQPFTKYHLNGVYNYTYSGAQLNFYINYADTLSLQYEFQRNN